MNQTISIISGKGGVGKTTFVSNLILALSLKFNKKILVIDMDIGNLFLSLNIQEQHFNVDLIDVLYDREKLSTAIYKFRKNLFFLGLKDKNILKHYSQVDFNLFIEDLKKMFDYIIFDVGAGINENFKKSVKASDVSIVVIEPTMLNYKISERTIDIMNDLNPNIKSFLVLNKYDINLAKKGYIVDKEKVMKNFKIPLIGIIPYNEKNIGFLNRGIPYYLNKKDNTFYEIYNKITARLLNKIG